MTKPRSLSHWKMRHAVLVWIGIALNLAFVLPLIFCPQWILSLFGLVVDQLIWPRFAGLLLGILSIFYVPATLDIDRYRTFAWLAVFPSRTAGALFFFTQVFVFGEPFGYLAGVFLDGSVGLATLYCLIRITRMEQDIMEGNA